jgi:hypothetical protein
MKGQHTALSMRHLNLMVAFRLPAPWIYIHFINSQILAAILGANKDLLYSYIFLVHRLSNGEIYNPKSEVFAIEVIPLVVNYRVHEY